VDRIKMMLDNMENLSDEELSELQSSIVGEFESVEKEEPTPQTVEAMTSLADMLDTVRGELGRREIQSQELAQQASEAVDRVHGNEATDEAVAEATEENPEESAMENKEEMPAAPAEESAETAPTEEPADEVEVDKEEEKEFSATDEVTLSVETEDAPVAEEAPVADAAAAPAEGSELSTLENESEIALSEENPIAQEVQEEIVEAPVTAAADANFEIEVPADRRPVVNEIPVAITAGADIPGVTAGSNFNTMSDVAEAFSKRLHGLRRVNGGDGEQHIVASFSTQYPEALQLGTNAEENWAKIQEVASPAAMIASGGYQSPYATRYDVFAVGTNARPVRDALPAFQADRGGIRFIQPPVLSDYGNAVGVWTTALDTAYVTNSYVSSATKSNLVVTPATETTAVADAVTLQLQFGNLQTRAYPELIARHNELGLIQHAREAEENLLSKLTSGSTAVTTTSVLGLAADFLLQVGRAAAAYRSRHRMEPDAQLRVVAPYWVKAAIRADYALQMPGDNAVSVSDAEIEGALAARGVNVTWHLDDSNFYGSQGASALNEFYDTFIWYIFAEGTFLFLDGGSLDLGIIRDSTLVGTNDYKMFVETFEGIAKVGVESLKVTSTIAVNGARAALRDTLGATTATTIEF
jgi:chemotaxis protein histidine kinase CheA